MIDSASNRSSRPPARPEANNGRRLSPPEELEVLIRARYPIIYVTSCEEERVERCLNEIALRHGKQHFVWTVTQGLVAAGAPATAGRSGSAKTADPLAALDAVIEQIAPAIYLFKDFHPFTSGERSNLSVVRRPGPRRTTGGD